MRNGDGDNVCGGSRDGRASGASDSAPNGGARTKRVIISGAGIAGLATALRFQRAGWRTLIVEKAPGRRSSGYMVNLLGTGYDAADRLGLVPALRPNDLGVFTSMIVNPDGSQKFTIPAALTQAALGKRAITVFRGDLESALYEAVRDTAEFRFGTTVREVDQDASEVRATLSDGTVESGDLLVGADGLHSGVRELVFGPETDFRVDLRHMVGAFPLPEVPTRVPDGASATYIGPLRTAAIVNLGPGRSSAFFAYRCEDPQAELARGAFASLAERFGDLGGGFPDALRQLKADPDAAYFDSVSQIDLGSWFRGRVVLLGDAAWCVTLFAGYGAALAMTGAERLGAAITESGVDLATALEQWEAELRPEVRKRQSLARKGTAQFCPPTRFHVWMRDTTIRAIQMPGIRNLVLGSLKRATR
ncbi:FAD-dependent oxidoreductase [Stackebrandtia nassauensis]|uniref:Monooxygenase FAD-binding protein n=1 Tax=Stackebrandtia nassauensis (strain DSM 44728 / CIP 108903 / NRRL B-16338 / NBRC 102104 / LLR-40K-21) TaxID=446470 RepID=D3PUV1_STANL|nr:FAD-dependent oxidoreductase [Stackebrandtia nassauensis]ADD44975.1 monooxygenase FAD-binding protein [Stackebrandtia nassauensis DSM 44728]